MELDLPSLKILRAAAGRIVQPADPTPPGDWKADLAWLILQQLDRLPPEQAQAFLVGLNSLANESWAVFGYPFHQLPGSQQDELLTRIENLATRTAWQHPQQQFISQLVTLTDEAARQIEAGHPLNRPPDPPTPPDEDSPSD